jgi:hypothetical protein
MMCAGNDPAGAEMDFTFLTSVLVPEETEHTKHGGHSDGTLA